MKTLNQETLDGLLELDADTGGTLVRELIATYRTEYPKRRAALEEHFKLRRGTELAFQAHAMKSAVGNFGAGRLAAIMQTIEHCAKADDWVGVTTAYDEMCREQTDFENDLIELQAQVEKAAHEKKRAS